jgi:hypothetical protein
MAIYEIEYAREHLAALFDDARDKKEVIIVRDDGKSCQLTPLDEVFKEEPAAAVVILPGDSDAGSHIYPST